MSAPKPMRLEFLGRDVVVTYRRDRQARCLWITFDYMRPRPAVQVDAVLGNVIAGLGYSHAHVFASGNHWFQTPEMEPVITMLLEVGARYERRIVWGSSMGGFAALQFASRLRADAALAHAPQLSINPAMVPWDTRFREQASEIPAFLYDNVASAKLPTATYLSYDYSVALDRLSAREIERHHPHVRTLVMPFAGHMTGTFMVGMHVVGTVFDGLAVGTLSGHAVCARRRAGRRDYGPYLDALRQYLRTRRSRGAQVVSPMN